MKLSRNTLLFRLMAGNLLVVVIIFGVAGIVSYRSLNAQYLREVEAYQHQLTSIAKQYVEHVWPTSDAEMDRLCKSFGAEPRLPAGEASDAGAAQGLPIRLTVIASDGHVMGDSEFDPAVMKTHKTSSRPEVLRALDGGEGQDTRPSETLEKPYRYVAEPIVYQGATVGAVRVAMPVQAISQARAVMRDTIVWTSVMSIIAFVIVGLLVNWVWHGLMRQAAAAGAQDPDD
jgi:two-component system, OmpR family, phosphate regulon sensor histidine kinase PhoR